MPNVRDTLVYTRKPATFTDHEMGWLILGFLCVAGLCGLAGTCLLSCCPPLPVVVEPAKVVVEGPCQLPPGPGALPAALSVTKDCPEAYVCYDLAGAKALLSRAMTLETWVLETKARCGSKGPASGPTTRPSTAAGTPK